ncbi:MAG: YkgJ family cysteine cluster protein [Xanthomonadaceae bacterium]|nr:YkgJ family cysteine cluster protein [Xanthomonadaceae bacterium]
MEWDPVAHSIKIDHCSDCKTQCCRPDGGRIRLELRQHQKEVRRFLYMSRRHPMRGIYSACFGCKARSRQGCTIHDRADRPVICNIYPFHLVDQMLWVDPSCPATQAMSWHDIVHYAEIIANYIETLEREFVLRLSKTTTAFRLVCTGIQLDFEKIT